MKMHRFIMVVAFLLVCALSAQAGDDLAGHPGYVDLDRIQIPVDAAEITEVNLGPELLKLAAGMENGNADLSKTLDGLFGIRVKSFGLTPELAEQTRPIVEDIQYQLENEGWKRLVYVKDGEELVLVSMKYDPAQPEKMAGLMVIAFDPADEAVFVNMVGSINLSDMGDLVDGIDVDLDNLLEGDTSGVGHD